MMRTGFLWLSALLLFFLGSVVTTAKGQNGSVVIEMGETVVTKAELDDRFRVALLLLARKQGISLTKQDAAVIERLRKQYLDKYATELVMLQEANRRNIAVPASQVEAAMEEILAKDGREEFLDELQDEGVDSETKLKEIVRNELTVELLIADILKEIVVPPGDVVTFHHDMKDHLATPEQVCVRHIQTDTAEAAEEIRAELERGGSFEELASERSTDPDSASSGGDLGCFANDRSHGASAGTEFQKAAFAAKEGEIVGPVASELDYHVIKVYERKPRHVPTLNEAYDQIALELAQEQLPERITSLVGESGIRTYPENFGAETLRE